MIPEVAFSRGHGGKRPSVCRVFTPREVLRSFVETFENG